MSPDIRCHRCDHIWTYGGSLQKATCPSCSSKVPVEENRIEGLLGEVADEFDLTVTQLRTLLRRVGDGER